MTVRTRFAPSPTGQIHIGNIRTAIYNWLFARHHGGQFLLRVEDTDRERSTPEAVQAVLEAMAWCGLDFDEDPLYQSGRASEHLASAEKLLAEGKAYRHRKGEGGEAVLFRIPLDGVDDLLHEVGPVELDVHSSVPVCVDGSGVSFALVSRKGKAMPQEGCLAGFCDLAVFDAAGKQLFSLDGKVGAVTSGDERFEISNATRVTFTRREISFDDLIKGRLSKSLDAIKDLVIVRSDGIPLFHMANVCDDAHQGVTHIIRGDDHVENTFRHILLFRALGLRPPLYAHLPMIVNQQGKPYSKRDGDAYVGDFREQGYLGDALFHYLAMLQWTPVDEREIMSRDEMVTEFDLARVKSSPAQVDLRKLMGVNGEFMKRLPRDQYESDMKEALVAGGLWDENTSDVYLRQVLEVMGDRIKVKNDIVRLAGFFFTDDYEFDQKAVVKRLHCEGAIEKLQGLKQCYTDLDSFDAQSLEAALSTWVEQRGYKTGDLIHPVRVAVSGLGIGPGLFDMLEVLGRERTCRRIDRAIERFGSGAGSDASIGD